MDISYKITADTAQFNANIRKSVDEIKRLKESGEMTAEQLDDQLKNIGKGIAIEGLEATEDNLQSIGDILKASGLSADEAAVAVGAFADNAKQAATATDEVGESASWLERQFAKMSEASGGMANIKAVVDMLPGPMQSVGQSAVGLLSTFKMMAKTPLLLVIQGLVWAFEQLKGFMSSTTLAGAEGFDDIASKGQVVNKIMAKFEAILATIANVGYRVAEVLYNAFTEPKKAISDLADAIRNMVNRQLAAAGKAFGSLGEIIKSALTLDMDGVKQGFDGLKDAIADGFDASPVGALIDEMKALGKETDELADKIEEIKNRQDALRINRAKWQAKEAQLDVGIRSAMTDIAEETDMNKRLKAIDKAQALINEKYAKRIEFAKEELRIKEMSNDPTASSLEDLEEVERLRSELINLEAAQQAESLRLVKQRAGIIKAQQAEEEAGIKELTKLRKAQQDEILSFEADSLSKTLKTIEAEKQARLAELEEVRQAWEENGKTMTDAQRDYYETQKSVIAQAAEVQTAQALTETYKTFRTEYDKMSAKYARDIETLRNQGYNEEADMAVKQRETELGSAATQWIESGMSSEEVQTQLADFANTIADMTSDALEHEIDNVRAALESSEEMAQLSPDQVALLYAKLDALKQKSKEVKKSIGKDVAKTGMEALRGFAEEAKNTGVALAELGEQFGGTFDEAAKVIDSCLQMAETVINSISIVAEGAMKLTAKTAVTAAEEIKTVERASVILAIIGAVLQALQAIAKAFKSSDGHLKEFKQDAEELRRKLKELRIEKDLLNKEEFVFGADAFGSFIDSAEDAIAYMENFGKSLAKAADQETVGNSMRLANLQLAGYKTSIADLGRMADASLSDIQAFAKGLEAVDIQTKHSTWFRSEKRATLGSLGVSILGESDEETMENLKEFVKSDLFGKMSKQQQDAISDMIADWDAYNKALEQAVQGLTGWFGGMADAFGDAIVTAFDEGTEAAELFSKSVGDVMRDFAKQLTQSLFLKDVLTDAEDQITDLIKNKDTTDPLQYANAIQDIALGTADKMKERMDDAEQFYASWSEGLDKAGYQADKAMDANTLSGAIAGASQESIDLLSGYCNAVRIQQVEGIDLLREQLVSLSGIESNTASVASYARRILERIEAKTTESESLRAAGI